jgi:serine/threonine protein phosphatase PrpC
MAKLWRSEVADPERALVEFVARAHTRMYWKARERGTSLGASCAVAWIVGDRLHFVELGTARVGLFRDGRLHRVGRSWPGGDRQRLLAGSVGLGDDSAVHLEPGRNAGTLALAPGDEVVVATDGLGRALDEASAALVLQHVDDPQVAAVTLLDRALARGATGGITVAIADLHGLARTTPRPEPSPPRRIRAAATEP